MAGGFCRGKVAYAVESKIFFICFSIFSTSLSHYFCTYNIMMPGSKGLSPHELAHRWVKDLRTRPDMSIKVG